MHSDTRSPKQRTLDCIAQFTAAPLTEKSRLLEDLSMTEQDKAELMLELEHDFRIMFDEEDEYTGPEIDNWVTVTDVIKAVYRLTKP
jgi:acyl carrier protein